MSNSLGQVKFPDGIIRYYEYYGTVDVCHPFLHNTREGVYENWRRNLEVPNCNHEPEKVEIASDYGGGFKWNGRACKECNVIKEGLHPDYENGYEDGHPEWWVQYKKEEEGS